MPEMPLSPLYDEETGLAEMAAARANPPDETTRHLLAIAGQLARHMKRHFQPGQLETAGRALLIGAASCADLANDGIQPVILVNLLGYTAERLVTEARTQTATQHADTRRCNCRRGRTCATCLQWEAGKTAPAD
jgi:hypothetical protein